jgi:hypothetical protein
MTEIKKNKLLSRLINEAIEEMANVSIDGLSDEFDIDSLYDDNVKQQGGEDVDDEVDFSDIPTNQNGKKRGSGPTGADTWTKAYNAYKRALKTRDSVALLNKLTQAYYSPSVINVRNNLKRDANNPDQFGRVKMQYTIKRNAKHYKDGPIGIISLFNIQPNDVHALCAALGNTRNTEWADVAATRENHGKDGVTFVVYLKNINKWKAEELPKIIKYLASRKDKDGKPLYGNPEQMQNLQDMLEARIYDDETINNDFYQAEKNNLERFSEYLSSEDDETVNAIIDLYSRFNVLDALCRDIKLPETYGHILSWRNARRIIGYGGNSGSGQRITFILPEKTWKEHFGRVLKPNARPIFVNVPNTKNWKGKWKNKTPISYPIYDKQTGKFHPVEFSSTEDILNALYQGRPYDQLSKQQQMRVNTLANSLNVKDTFLIHEFDISDTVYEPSLGIPDKWTEEVGLENNLTGALNQKAKDDMEQFELERQKRKEAGDAEEGPGINEKDAEIVQMEQRTHIALENVTGFAKKRKFRIVDANNESLTLINTLLRIAEALIPEEIGITKHSFVTELAENAVYFVCRLEKIALDHIKTFRHVQKVDQNTMATFSTIVDTLIYAVEIGDNQVQAFKQALEESVEMDNEMLGGFVHKDSLVKKKIEAFLSKISQEAEQEEANQINESFYCLLQRMDDSKKNLL